MATVHRHIPGDSMTERNGTISRWIMNGLLTIVLLLVTWWVNGLSDRLNALEDGRKTNAENIQAVHDEVRDMHYDLCASLSEMYRLRSKLFPKETIFRRPCP